MQLLNITSSLDVGHFIALLKTKLKGVELTAYSVDTPGPQSEHSQHLKIQFLTSECPKGLEQIYRIFWINYSILVHHVAIHRQLPCLNCGVSGHLACACANTVSDLKTTNCITFTQDDL